MLQFWSFHRCNVHDCQSRSLWKQRYWRRPCVSQTSYGNPLANHLVHPRGAPWATPLDLSVDVRLQGMGTKNEAHVSPLSHSTTLKCHGKTHFNVNCSLWCYPDCVNHQAYRSLCFRAEEEPKLAAIPLEIVVHNVNQAYESDEITTPRMPFWGILFTNCKQTIFEN